MGLVRYRSCNHSTTSTRRPIKARELILLGEKQTADALYRMGIAWKVAPEEELNNEVMRLVRKLSKLSVRSLKDLKRGINLGSYEDIEIALAYEAEIFIAASMDVQTMENIKNFHLKKTEA